MYTTLLLAIFSVLAPPSLPQVQAASETMQGKNQHGVQKYTLKVKWPKPKTQKAPTSNDVAEYIGSVAEYTEICDPGRGLFWSVNQQSLYPSFECLVTISGNSLSCIYADPLGVVCLNGQEGIRRWSDIDKLRRRRFDMNNSVDVDKAILKWLSSILTTATSVTELRLNRTLGNRDWIIAHPEMGKLQLHIDNSSIRVQRIDLQNEQLLLNYEWQADTPEESERLMANTRARMSGPEPNKMLTIDLGDSGTFDSGLVAANHLREPSEIELRSLPKIAARVGFVLPEDLSTIKRAVGTQLPSSVRQLTLDVSLGKTRVFSLTQFSPPIEAPAIPAHFVQSKKTSGGFTILLVRDPGTRTTTTEYIRPDVSFSVRGSYFADEDLEAFISSFRAVE